MSALLENRKDGIEAHAIVCIDDFDRISIFVHREDMRRVENRLNSHLPMQLFTVTEGVTKSP